MGLEDGDTAFKINTPRASLEDQWLRLPMQGAWVRFLVKELRSDMPCSQKTKT